jgi:hypothetical protein
MRIFYPFILLLLLSCNSNQNNNQSYIKANINGITHNYPAKGSRSGVTVGLSGTESVGSYIFIAIANNTSKTYNLCTSCGVSLSSQVQLVYNYKTFTSEDNGNIVANFNNGWVSGTFQGNLYDINNNPTFCTGSFNVRID